MGNPLGSYAALLPFRRRVTGFSDVYTLVQGGQWEPYWAALEQPVRDKLTVMYGL